MKLDGCTKHRLTTFDSSALIIRHIVEEEDAAVKKVLTSFGLAMVGMCLGACGSSDGGETAPSDGSGSPASAAEDTATPASEPSSAPVYAVELANGNRFEVYEYEPGAVAFSETGRIGSPPFNVESLSGLPLSEVIRAVRPDIEETPTEILALQERIDAAAANSEDIATLPSANEPETLDAPAADEGPIPKFTAQEWRDQICSVDQLIGGQCHWEDNCWPNSTGDYTFYKGDVHHAYAAANAYRGEMTLRLRRRNWFDWSTVGSILVEQGYWRYWWAGNDCDQPACHCSDFDMEVKITGASGDGYHLNIQYME